MWPYNKNTPLFILFIHNVPIVVLVIYFLSLLYFSTTSGLTGKMIGEIVIKKEKDNAAPSFSPCGSLALQRA
jgi:hypothetical protein